MTTCGFIRRYVQTFFRSLGLCALINAAGFGCQVNRAFRNHDSEENEQRLNLNVGPHSSIQLATFTMDENPFKFVH